MKNSMVMKKRIFGLSALTLGILLLAGATALPAHAKPYKSVESSGSSSQDPFKGNPGPYQHNATFGFGLNYFDAFGIHGRYAYRLLEKGPIPDINNSLYLEAGLGLSFYGNVNSNTDVTGAHALIAGRWDFQMDFHWVFFGEVGFGMNTITNANYKEVRGGGLFPVVGVGALYNFDEEWSARGDVAYQLIGVGIMRRF